MRAGLSGLGRFSESGLLVLMSLALGDKHGYGVIVDIRDTFGIKLGPATLYQTLDRLEARGLIEPLAAEERRRPYRMTSAGEAELREQLLQMQRLAAAGLERLAES
jgi:DNA-binding PadR family transcriptional regulator